MTNLQVQWNNTSRKEKFYFENPKVCLIFNVGELSLIEYGENCLLTSVRTEFANPHLISVQITEKSRKFAYLLDLKTICIINIVTGLSIHHINHDCKIDWLELSETGQKMLFRDLKQR